MRIPKLFIFLFAITFLVTIIPRPVSATDDVDEFEEFGDFDDLFDRNPASVKESKDAVADDDDDFAAVVEDDDDEPTVAQPSGSTTTRGGRPAAEEVDNDEFDHFQDEEEFEGFHGNPDDDDELPAAAPQQPQAAASEPKLTMAKVPLHFRTHWDSYYMEMLLLAGIMAYFANYVLGRGKNANIVSAWLSTHRSLLEDNFVLVGDDGRLDVPSASDSDQQAMSAFVKESESHFSLWCSGRTCCEGMLVELKLLKRQDLVSVLAGYMKPAHDQMLLKVELSKDIFDTFVFAVATKRAATRLFKEQSDLSKFCTLVAKAEDKYKVPQGFAVLSEIPEASAAVLDARLLAALHKYAALIEYIHISDQYTGPVAPAEDAEKVAKQPPEVKRMLMAAFNLPKGLKRKKKRHSDDDDENDDEDEDNSSKALLTLVFYLMERLKRYRLSREGKAKAEKNRQRVEEQFLKSTHAARAEAAAAKREEKRRAEKEKILAEQDPEKQRRMEAKEQKREAKKKAPRMKKLSIKAM